MESPMMVSEKWDGEYLAGKWDHLEDDKSEAARLNIIGDYCNKRKPAGKILDVGCGTGKLWDYLSLGWRAGYLGIDCSQEAIRLGQNKRPAKLIQHLAADFTTDTKFDVIVFSELLYYVDFLKIVTRYLNFLAPDGLVMISLWRRKWNPGQLLKRWFIWQRVSQKLKVVWEREYIGGDKMWIIRALGQK